MEPMRPRSVSDDSSMLNELEGSQLSSVEFVMDYVQLRFDGPTLTVYNQPAVRTEHETIKWGDVRFRNALCGLIAHIVSSTDVRRREAAEIVFDNGSVFIVPLGWNDFRGPEALTFDAGGDFWVLQY